MVSCHKITITLLILFLGGFPATTVALDYIDEHKNTPWSVLDYEASKMLLTVKTRVTISKKITETVVDELITAEGQDVLQPADGAIFIVTTDTENFGTRTRYMLWFDEQARILQRLKVRNGKKKDVKLYRFTPGGIVDLRKKADIKNLPVDHEFFNDARKKFKPFTGAPGNSAVISESSAFLYLVSMLKLEKAGDEATFTVFSRNKLINVKLLAKGIEKLDVDYRVKRSNSNQHINGERDVLKIAVLPLDNDGKPVKKFKLLGLQGNIAMYLDLENRLLVQVTGDVKVLGRVDAKLKQAVKAE